MAPNSTRTRVSKVAEPEVTWTTREDMLEDPAKANADIAALLKDNVPAITMPSDDLVNLPGGIIVDGKLHKTAVVRELNGEHEELLAKASQSYPLNPWHFIDRLLRCGVVQIGDLPESRTEQLLKEMLVGDREQLLLGIRRATYGEELDIDNWQCPNCNNVASLSMLLEDIPCQTLENPEEELTFTVPLKKGGSARVRLATGDDNRAMFEKPLTQAQQQSIVLSRCVLDITNPNGVVQNVAGFPSLVLGMSVPDRHKILDELRTRQPGPKYDEIKYECESCGEEVNVAVSVGHLFLDFGWV